MDTGRKKDMTLYECPLNDHIDGYRQKERQDFGNTVC